jgi:hypothetical protein
VALADERCRLDVGQIEALAAAFLAEPAADCGHLLHSSAFSAPLSSAFIRRARSVTPTRSRCARRADHDDSARASRVRGRPSLPPPPTERGRQPSGARRGCGSSISSSIEEVPSWRSKVRFPDEVEPTRRDPALGYRYRTGGRGSRWVQRGGFGSEQDARESFERALEQVRRRMAPGARSRSPGQLMSTSPSARAGDDREAALALVKSGERVRKPTLGQLRSGRADCGRPIRLVLAITPRRREGEIIEGEALGRYVQSLFNRGRSRCRAH